MRVDHLMYAEDFKLLVKRLETLKSEDIDPNIAKFVSMVNLSQELVTIFSCEGHKGKKNGSVGYVMFGVRDRKHIEKLYELVREEFGEDQHLVSLAMTTRLNIVRPQQSAGKRGRWYAVWNLSWKHNLLVTRQDGWIYLEKAAVKFLLWVKEYNAYKNS